MFVSRVHPKNLRNFFEIQIYFVRYRHETHRTYEVTRTYAVSDRLVISIIPRRPRTVLIQSWKLTCVRPINDVTKKWPLWRHFCSVHPLNFGLCRSPARSLTLINISRKLNSCAHLYSLRYCVLLFKPRINLADVYFTVCRS